jgi:hypothetical protein
MICAIAQPQLEQNDLPQLRLVAVKSEAKTLETCANAIAIYKPVLN